jgi:hypothetical protein
LGGTGSIWATNKIKSIFSGEPYYDKEDGLGDQILSDLSNIGAFGMVSQMIQVDNITKLPDAIKFLITPVFVSDAMKVHETYTNILRDWHTYGDGWLATRRNAHDMFAPLGSLPRLAAERTMGVGQRANRVKYRKSQEKGEIFRAWLEGDSREASKRIRLWNENYDENPFGMDEISPAALRKWVDNRVRKYAEQFGEEATSGYREAEKSKRKELGEALKALKPLPATR